MDRDRGRRPPARPADGPLDPAEAGSGSPTAPASRRQTDDAPFRPQHHHGERLRVGGAPHRVEQRARVHGAGERSELASHRGLEGKAHGELPGGSRVHLKRTFHQARVFRAIRQRKVSPPTSVGPNSMAPSRSSRVRKRTAIHSSPGCLSWIPAGASSGERPTDWSPDQYSMRRPLASSRSTVRNSAPRTRLGSQTHTKARTRQKGMRGFMVRLASGPQATWCPGGIQPRRVICEPIVGAQAGASRILETPNMLRSSQVWPSPLSLSFRKDSKERGAGEKGRKAKGRFMMSKVGIWSEARLARVTPHLKSVVNESSFCAAQRRHLARRRLPVIVVDTQRPRTAHTPRRSEAKPR